jgi:hypothetical protein
LLGGLGRGGGAGLGEVLVCCWKPYVEAHRGEWSL